MKLYSMIYDESTVAKLRTDYLHSLQRKYEAEMQRYRVIFNERENYYLNYLSFLKFNLNTRGI